MRHGTAPQRGYSLLEENTPFGTPRETRGAFPLDPMPEEHDNGESRIPRITEKLVRPFKRASMPILRKALEAGIIRGTSPDLVFSLLMGAVSATLLAPQISGESPAANMDFRERAAENLLLLVLK